MTRFLIIQTASVGDVILTTPVLESLHKSIPDSQIDYLLKKGNETLFTEHPYLHDIIIWNKEKSRYRDFLRILSHVRKQRYDYVINVQRFFSTGWLTACSRAGVKVGFDKNPLSIFFHHRVHHEISGKNDIHEVDRNLMLIREITDKTNRLPVLYPSSGDFVATAVYKNRPYLCMAPASLWYTKQYPPEKWIEFIRSVSEDYAIYCIGSEKDNGLCNHLIETSGRGGMQNLAGRLTFLQTAALMKDAVMSFVNDSAPQHLASAVNAPVTTIFCSTIPAFGFGPLSVSSHIVERNEKLYCRPCGLHGFRECPEKHFKCAYDIRNEQLLRIL
jgi:ADP-heptose:LPS heptosyltransferase